MRIMSIEQNIFLWGVVDLHAFEFGGVIVIGCLQEGFVSEAAAGILVGAVLADPKAG